MTGLSLYIIPVIGHFLAPTSNLDSSQRELCLVLGSFYGLTPCLAILDVLGLSSSARSFQFTTCVTVAEAEL